MAISATCWEIQNAGNQCQTKSAKETSQRWDFNSARLFTNRHISLSTVAMIFVSESACTHVPTRRATDLHRGLYHCAVETDGRILSTRRSFLQNLWHYCTIVSATRDYSSSAGATLDCFPGRCFTLEVLRSTPTEERNSYCSGGSECRGKSPRLSDVHI